MSSKQKVSILFVCMGNICRSPTAEGVFRKLVEDAELGERIHTDSAGTHAYHTGESPDHRAQAAAERRGFSLKGIRARRVSDTDFESFDYIVAMDDANLATLREWAPAELHGKLSLMLQHSAVQRERDVPDPYYGGAGGFERVLDLVEEASAALLETIRREL